MYSHLQNQSADPKRAPQFGRRIAAVIAVLVSAPALIASDSWTQWRGPDRDGTTAGTLPSQLSDATLQSQWDVELGPSYSGPIVSDKYVFTTETADQRDEVVRAFDRTTGTEVWNTKWEGSMAVPFFAAANGSWIRSTPALDGDRLYVAGIRDYLVCLDANSGDKVWDIDFTKVTGSSIPSFGCASSPLLHGDHVFIQAGNSVVKINKSNGVIVWQNLKDEGGMTGGAFSSPVVATIGGVSQLVVQTRAKLAGVDLETGKELWSQEIPAFRGMNILTPTVVGDSVFTSSYGGNSLMLKISQAGGTWTIDEQWRHKSQAYMSSPVLVDGHLYVHLRNQRFLCLNAATGEECWTTKPFGKYWSMIVANGKILALDENGELLLIEASPEEFRVVERRTVAEDSWAHVAVAGSQLFVRDLAALKVFDFK